MKIILRRGGTIEDVITIVERDGEKRRIFRGHAKNPRIIEMSNIFEIYEEGKSEDTI